MRADLLAALSAHLRTVAPETFDLEMWSCGTTACAIGHAVNVPSIAANGLQLTTHVTDIDYRTPIFNRSRGWAAVEECFQLSEDQAEHLFAFEDYPDKQDAATVSDRIDAFISEAA